MKDLLIQKTKDAFHHHFGMNPNYVFLSPGRINVIGEHIDYNDGFVLPAAIDKYICFAINKRSDSDICRMIAHDFNDFYSFNLVEEILKSSSIWANYLLGVADEIKKTGRELGGLDLVFCGNIPIGAGLSSSAALECGFAYALNTIFNLNLTKEEIVLIGQKSENNFVGVNCGVMDQFASVFGKNGKAVMVNCDSLEYEYFDATLDDYRLILFDSCIKHTHLTSGYNDRREEMEKGKEITKNHFNEMITFRDCTHEMLDSLKNELGDKIYKRCKYVIEEIKRVEDAAQSLAEKDFKRLGKLLTQTHYGLSKEYEVSCCEIDFLVEQTLKLEGVAGARMMGGGFGGCSINLIKNENVYDVINKIKDIYKQEYSIDMNVYEVKISEGTHQYIENEYSI